MFFAASSTGVVGYHQTLFKIHQYSSVQNTEMMTYVKSTVENIEKVLQSKLDMMESVIEYRLVLTCLSGWSHQTLKLPFQLARKEIRTQDGNFNENLIV